MFDPDSWCWTGPPSPRPPQSRAFCQCKRFYNWQWSNTHPRGQGRPKWNESQVSAIKFLAIIKYSIFFKWTNFIQYGFICWYLRTTSNLIKVSIFCVSFCSLMCITLATIPVGCGLLERISCLANCPMNKLLPWIGSLIKLGSGCINDKW